MEICPYIKAQDNLIAFLNEVLLSIYLMTCLALTDYNEEMTHKNIVALALIGVVGCSIVINVTNLIIETIIFVKE